jgi:hypothetical protein
MTIPAKEIGNLANIVGYDKVFFDSLIKALSETKPSLTRTKYTADLISRLPGATEKEISPVLNTLFNLYSIKNRNGISASDLAKQIKEAAVNSKEHRASFLGVKGGILESRLTALLSYDNSLAVTVKALALMREHQRVLCHARILTDVRPVFSNVPEQPSAAMIVHNLQIGFKNSAGENHEEFYVAIDDDDLVLLADTIERAQQKSKALKTTLEKSQITCLE